LNITISGIFISVLQKNTNVLLPIDEDPLCLASAIGKIWHKNLNPEIALTEARNEMKNERNIFKKAF
jgi:hypothetical protein